MLSASSCSSCSTVATKTLFASTYYNSSTRHGRSGGRRPGGSKRMGGFSRGRHFDCLKTAITGNPNPAAARRPHPPPTTHLHFTVITDRRKAAEEVVVRIPPTTTPPRPAARRPRRPPGGRRGGRGEPPLSYGRNYSPIQSHTTQAQKTRWQLNPLTHSSSSASQELLTDFTMANCRRLVLKMGKK